jgi:hypothetical protein
VLAEPVERDARRQGTATRSDAVSERQNLAAVAAAAIRAARWTSAPDVLAVRVERAVAGVQPHPDTDLGAVGPGLGRKVALGVDRGGHASAHVREHGEDPVALGLLLVAADVPGSPPG